MIVPWRMALLALLMLTPLAAYIGVGAYVLVRDGWFFWTWWVLPLAWGLAFLLARRWRKEIGLPAAETVPPYWTARDVEAWRLVESASAKAAAEPLQRLADLRFYAETAEVLARELAPVYHPKSSDPVGGLTVPEILAAAELAVSDLSLTVNQFVPASHLLTIDRWRMLAKLPGYYQSASTLGWVLGGVLNPFATATRYLASRLTVAPATDLLQTNALGWFASAFVQRTGASLIEMYSGRLRVGADRWRELKSRIEGGASPSQTLSESAGSAREQRFKGPAKNAADDTPAPPVDSEPVSKVCIVVAGQARAGKTSVIQALLAGQPPSSRTSQSAAVGQETAMTSAEGDHLTLIDTPGYSAAGPQRDRVEETCRLFQKADLALLVMAANNPARSADLELLDQVQAWYAQNPELKSPPILAVLTHVDLLPPPLEWSPPYDDWADPNAVRPKARSIGEAVRYTLDILGNRIAGAAPVCSDVGRGRTWGVEELLLPAMTRLLDHARGTAIVRGLRGEAERGKIRKLAGQLLGVGQLVWSAVRR